MLRWRPRSTTAPQRRGVGLAPVRHVAAGEACACGQNDPSGSYTPDKGDTRSVDRSAPSGTASSQTVSRISPTTHQPDSNSPTATARRPARSGLGTRAVGSALLRLLRAERRRRVRLWAAAVAETAGVAAHDPPALPRYRRLSLCLGDSATFSLLVAASAEQTANTLHELHVSLDPIRLLHGARHRALGIGPRLVILPGSGRWRFASTWPGGIRHTGTRGSSTRRAMPARRVPGGSTAGTSGGPRNARGWVVNLGRSP